jgi:hypothetical protein
MTLLHENDIQKLCSSLRITNLTVMTHVPSQGPHLSVSQNPNTARLWANNRALQIRDRDGVPHLFAAGYKGVLLKVTVIHLPEPITAERLLNGMFREK